MATSFAATTPTRSRSPARVHTPPTPRLGGYHDNWEPYSPTRKSARISSRLANSHANNRTPSPTPHSSARISRPRHQANTSAARTAGPPSTTDMHSPPATLSPQKKRQPTSASASALRTASGSLTAQSIRDAAVALKMDSTTSAPRAGLALPTPAKTPARLNPEQTDKEVTAIARNLFGAQAQEDAPLTVKKTRTKRSVGVSRRSFEILDDEAPIEIFTDSENRVPEVDDTTENPFYGEAGITAAAAPVRRSPRHRNSAAVAKEKELVEEKLSRDDGLLYVFRGKKVFKKFANADAARRAAVAPRVLFPAATRAAANVSAFDEEEAETDIEEEITIEEETTAEEEITLKEQIIPDTAIAGTDESSAESPETPEDVEKTKTPKAPRHAPASPPSTSRATRSKKHLLEETTPTKPKGGKRGASGGRSPFAGWRRTKNSPSSSTSRKRAGDALTATTPKRSKS